MDKSVNAGNDPCKCAEWCKADYLNLALCAYRILIFKDLPGVILGLSVAKRDLLRDA